MTGLVFFVTLAGAGEPDPAMLHEPLPPHYTTALETYQASPTEPHQTTLIEARDAESLRCIEANDAGDLYAARTACERSLFLGEAATFVGDANLEIIRRALGKLNADLGDLNAAAHHYQGALENQRATLGNEHPTTGFTLVQLAGVQFATSRETSKANYLEGLRILEATEGPDAPLVGQVRLALGSVLQAMDELDNAEASVRRGLEIFIGAFGPDDAQVLPAMQQLADLLMVREAYAESEGLVRRQLVIQERIFGTKDRRTLESLHMLASLRHLQGDPSEALTLIQERYQRRADVDTLADLALQTSRVGQLKEAEARYSQLVDQLRRTVGNSEKTAHALAGLARVRAERSNPSGAEQAYREALAVLDAMESPPLHLARNFTDALVQLLLQQTGRDDDIQALLQAQLARTTTSERPDAALTGESWYNLGRHHVGNLKWREAEAAFRQAAALLRTPAEPSPLQLLNLAQTLNWLGRTQNVLGRNTEALRTLNEALTLTTQYGDQGRMGSVRLNLGNALASLGRLQEAEVTVRTALADYEAHYGREHRETVIALGNLAEVTRLQGRFADAEAQLRRVIALEESGLGVDDRGLVFPLNNLAATLRAQGRIEEAEATYDRALTIAEANDGRDAPLVGTLLNNLAVMLLQAGRSLEAESRARRALAIAEATTPPGHPYRNTRIGNVAATLRDQKRYDEARTLLEEALAASKASLPEGHPETGILESNLGELLSTSGNDDAALPHYLHALRIHETTLGPTHPTVGRDLLNLSLLYVRLGDLESAHKTLERTLEVEESSLRENLFAASSDQRRQTFVLFDITTADALTLHLQHRPTTEASARLALLTLLRRKGRLVDLEQDTVQMARRSGDSTALAKLEELEGLLARRGVLQNTPPQDTAARQAWEAETERLDRATTQLERELAALSSPFREALRPVTLEAVTKVLPKDAALIEYVVYEPYDFKAIRFEPARYAAYVLQPDGSVTAHDLGLAKEIDTLIAKFRTGLVQQAPLSELGPMLYERVLEPVLKGLTADRLLVSSDGLLNLVPLDAVRAAYDLEGEDERRFSYLTSGRDLLRTLPSEQAAPPTVVFDVDYDKAEREGVPIEVGSRLRWQALPGAAAEGRAVAEQLGAQTLTATQATETRVKELEGPRILHVASHGYFAAEQPAAPPLEPTRGLDFAPRPPGAGEADSALYGNLAGATQGGASPLLRSGIVLAGANALPQGNDDGMLTAAEVANLDLQGTDLVVLSACETGLGEVRNGDGVHGLRRALILAGSEAQVLSLWQVDDAATQALMQRFYKRIGRGDTVDKALARAQRSLRREIRWNHPYYWASFTVSGNADVSPRARRRGSKR
ncbi:MAG: CHAT domain-containing tetratricopeptide repeat protein [Myxococcota bacterium]